MPSWFMALRIKALLVSSSSQYSRMHTCIPPSAHLRYATTAKRWTRRALQVQVCRHYTSGLIRQGERAASRARTARVDERPRSTRRRDRRRVFHSRRAARRCASRVEAIEQRAGDSLLVARDNRGRARAVTRSGRGAPVAARTGIHRGDQLEVGREGQRAAGAGDRHDVIFERWRIASSDRSSNSGSSSSNERQKPYLPTIELACADI
jgi:hypothetical protein